MPSGQVLAGSHHPAAAFATTPDATEQVLHQRAVLQLGLVLSPVLMRLLHANGDGLGYTQPTDGRAQQEAPHGTAMDNTERVQRLWALYEQLDALIEPEEIEVYPVLEHLGDLIGDLEMD